MYMIDLKTLLAERGVSAAALAQKIGITPVALSNIATGKSIPNLDTAVKIANGLGISIAHLVGEEEPPKRETAVGTLVCPHCGSVIEMFTHLPEKEQTPKSQKL